MRQPATARPSTPAGLTADLARFITSAGRTTSVEAGIAGALTVIAGLAGANYAFEDAALAGYIAQPADHGRSAADHGIARLAAALADAGCDLDAYLGPIAFDAPTVAARHLADISSSFFAAVDGGLAAAIQCEGGQGAIAQYRRLLTTVWDAAGRGRFSRSQLAAVAPLDGAITRPTIALLLLGEPRHLSLTLDDFLVDGFYPRLTCIPAGEVVENRRAAQVPSADLTQRMAEFARAQISMAKVGAVQEITADPTAARRLGAFRREAADHIAAPGEIERIVWRHALQQAQRIAATCAVGRDWYTPHVTGEDVDFACAIVRKSCAYYVSQTETSDLIRKPIHEQQDGTLHRLARQWMLTNVHKRPCKFDPEQVRAMQRRRAVPVQWFRERGYSLAPFVKDPAGPKLAIDRALERMTAAGICTRPTRNETEQWFSSSAHFVLWREPVEA